MRERMTDLIIVGVSCQKVILALICSLRGELLAVVTCPKLAESMLVPGAAKYTEFVTLKMSKPSATFKRSLIEISRRTVISSLRIPCAASPNGADRGRLPKVYGAGLAKARLSRYAIAPG